MGSAAVLETPVPAAPLGVADRCDRCGAQAFVRAVLPGGSDLLFCAHHARAYDERLRAVASYVQDESDRINAKPSPSAY